MHAALAGHCHKRKAHILHTSKATRSNTHGTTVDTHLQVSWFRRTHAGARQERTQSGSLRLCKPRVAQFSKKQCHNLLRHPPHSTLRLGSEAAPSCMQAMNDHKTHHSAKKPVGLRRHAATIPTMPGARQVSDDRANIPLEASASSKKTRHTASHIVVTSARTQGLVYQQPSWRPEACTVQGVGWISNNPQYAPLRSSRERATQHSAGRGGSWD